jgi:two-component system, NarL family, sensor histidine kinase DevS
MGELDMETLLRRLLGAAREITGARYAALGVLNEERTELARFITSGIAEEARQAIGSLPRGRGVLGLLIEDPRALRLRDIGGHPRSYGFPAAHPQMHSFLGMPIMIRGEAWGNLYLTEKPGGEFTEIDEEDVAVLAGWAAVAIDNARQFERSERQRIELARAVRALEATRDIAVAIGGETRLEHVLELIVKRGRALVNARVVLIMLRDGAELVVAAATGGALDATGVRVPIAESASGQVLELGRAERVADVSARMTVTPERLGVPGAHTALLVPMLHRGQRLGVLTAFDRGDEGAPFTDSDEQLLQTFAASAANAVALAQSVEADRLRSSLAAAETERGRWARELHDETLQGLGSLRVLLAGSLRQGDPERMTDAVRQAVAQLETEIAALRALISELRPAALDQLGLREAIEALAERHGARGELQVRCALELPGTAPAGGALEAELETIVYRLVQEALTNVAKHAGASTVEVMVRASGEELAIEVRDDGVGFDTAALSSGYGLKGMRERVALVGGTLQIVSGGDGTCVRAALPVGAGSVEGGSARSGPGGADQTPSRPRSSA